MKVIVLSHPRSSSSYLVDQISRSPRASMVTRGVGQNYEGGKGELFHPVDPVTGTFKNFHPHAVDTVRAWFQAHPDTVIKLFPWNLTDLQLEQILPMADMVVTLRRMDLISTLASAMATDHTRRWDKPSAQLKPTYLRLNPDRFELQRTLKNRYVMMLRSVYWMRQVDQLVPNVIHLRTEEFHPDYHNPFLEDPLDIRFDFSTYQRPSEFSETFTDSTEFLHDLGAIMGRSILKP